VAILHHSFSGRGDKGRARPVTDPLATFGASGQHHGLRRLKVGGLMGLLSHHKTLRELESLVRVGPVGLEPTTYGLKVPSGPAEAEPDPPV
jgi:hypothetical protein